jgi:hypothetical protein
MFQRGTIIVFALLLFAKKKTIKKSGLVTPCITASDGHLTVQHKKRKNEQKLRRWALFMNFAGRTQSETKAGRECFA